MIPRENWFAVDKYLAYRLEVDQVSEKTVRLEKTWLRHLLLWAEDNHFSQVPNIRPSFPQHMIQTRLDDSEEMLSESYIKKAISTTKHFLKWLTTHKRGYGNIKPHYLDTLKTPRIQQQPKKHEVVSLE